VGPRVRRCATLLDAAADAPTLVSVFLRGKIANENTVGARPCGPRFVEFFFCGNNAPKAKMKQVCEKLPASQNMGIFPRPSLDVGMEKHKNKVVWHLNFYYLSM
jgi:hypothetical protein